MGWGSASLTPHWGPSRLQTFIYFHLSFCPWHLDPLHLLLVPRGSRGESAEAPERGRRRCPRGGWLGLSLAPGALHQVKVAQAITVAAPRASPWNFLLRDRWVFLALGPGRTGVALRFEALSRFKRQDGFPHLALSCLCSRSPQPLAARPALVQHPPCRAVPLTPPRGDCSDLT